MNSKPLRLLFTGRLVHWKGMHLGLAAFSRLLKEHPDAEVTIVGEGPAAARWRRLAIRLGIEKRVRWISWMPRDELLPAYLRYDVYLFPSLHDSGGISVLEAMASGLPVVALDLGGPGTMVDETCGRSIPVHGRKALAVIDALGNALLELAADPALRGRLSEGAIQRASEYSWQRTVMRTYHHA